MFNRIGRFSATYRWPIIIGWIALAVIITLTAPNLDKVASSDSADFLPANAPYTEGVKRLRDNFPGSGTLSSAVVIVVETTDGSSIRDEPGWSYLADLTTWLQSDAAPENTDEVLSPTSGIPLMADSLIAPDNQMAIIQVKFDGSILGKETKSATKQIQQYMDEHTPDGIAVFQTGSGPILGGYSSTALESVDRTLGITVVLVILMLLLVYRSPVSPLVPLITVGISYFVSRGIVGWMGAHMMTVTIYANVILVVILFGAGTDYCLFLISRFREELADDGDAHASAERTVGRVGETIASSAGTVIVGFVSMSFAEMGLFNTTGPALAVGVVVVLLAGLTLTPAMLSLIGQWAFWPGHASHRSVGRIYARMSALVAERPVQTIIVIVLVLGPLALFAMGQRTTYDMLADLPSDYPARAGFVALDRHMGGGQIQPLDVVIDDLAPDTAMATIDHWTQEMLTVDGVDQVRSLAAPLGQSNDLLVGITRIDRQLSLASDALASLGSGGDSASQTMTPENMQLAMSALPFVQDYLNMLETRFPEMAGNEDLAAIRETLNGLAVAALQGNLNESLASLQTHLAALSEAFASIDNAYYLPESLPENLVSALGLEDDPLQSLTARYLSTNHTAARFEVILAGNPYGDEATDVVRALRDKLPGGEKAVSGYPAVMTDLRDTMDRDMFRSFSLVLIGIFVVLLLLLRALVAPVYLILTILLSYGATMGITRFASGVLFGTEALTWWVPFFIFVMLIALGMDYNIFLMGRVKEEVAKHGNREGVHQAVGATGAIITSAGIIMAGTFAAMMAGLVTGLRQLGMAVAVGVLLDTFVIRTVLVPAIAVLLDRWNWWPGKAPQLPTSPDALSSSKKPVPDTGD
jgi:RND superfamily putative drug exporter